MAEVEVAPPGIAQHALAPSSVVPGFESSDDEYDDDDDDYAI